MFLHIRIENIAKFKPSHGYFNKILSNINFDNCHIFSDTINATICKKLIKKYKIKIIESDEIIMFASTCKHIILSNETFLWLIGFLGIYFLKIKKWWHSNIFVFDK